MTSSPPPSVTPPRPPAPPAPTTEVRRLGELQRHDRAALDAVLDAGVVAHLAVVDAGHPYVIPMAYVRDGDQLLLHGSTGSRLMRVLADGAPTCATVTLFDGLVVARSAAESSMHYRSAMVLGRCTPATDRDAALRRLTDGLVPGRTAEVRANTRRELAATEVLVLPLASWSVKISDGDPDDLDEDLAGDAWAGVVPMVAHYGVPRPAADLRAGIEVPPSIGRLRAAAGPQGAGETGG